MNMTSIAVLFSDFGRANEARRDLEAVESFEPSSISIHTQGDVFENLKPAARTQFPEGIALGATWCALVGVIIGVIVAASTSFFWPESVGWGGGIGALYGAVVGGLVGARAQRPEITYVERELDHGRALVIADVKPGADAVRTRSFLMQHAGAMAPIPAGA
jgi:hypothetical protein